MINTQEINNLREHDFIVIGYEHYNPLGVIRSLGEVGISPYLIITTGTDIKIASKSKYIKETIFINSYEEVLDILLSRFINDKKVFLYPCDDNITEYLDKHYNELKDNFYFSNAGEDNRIYKYQDKVVTANLAKHCGMNIPKTWEVKVGEIPHDIVFPILTKPSTSYAGWKSDYYICNNKQELCDAYSKIKVDSILLQSYIEKKNEYSVDGIVWNHGENVFISVQTLYTYLLPDYYSMEMIHSTFDNDEIQSFLEKMFKEIKYEGIFSIDVLIDKNDDKWFLEINYRNSAWSYASTKLGMNLPLLWAYAMINGVIPSDSRKNVPDNYIALAEITDYEQRVARFHYISPFEWFKGVLKADCLYVWNFKDPLPAINAWKDKLFRKIKKYFLNKK